MRGYPLSAFEEAFESYLPAPSHSPLDPKSRYSATMLYSCGSPGFSKKPTKPLFMRLVTYVAAFWGEGTNRGQKSPQSLYPCRSAVVTL